MVTDQDLSGGSHPYNPTVLIALWTRRGLFRAAVMASAVAMFALVLATPVKASRALEQFRVQSWTRSDGLPSPRIFAITQDTDGYLWLGTPSGLVRFDGIRFVPWEAISETKLPGDVLGLMHASDGSVWAAFGNGSIARIQGRQVAIYGEHEGLTPGFLKTFAEDRNGSIWAGGRGGLFRFDNGFWKRQGPESGLPDGPNYGLFTDRSDVLWVVTPSGVYRRTTEGRFAPSLGVPPLIAASERLARSATSAPAGVAANRTPLSVTLTGNALNPLTALEDREGTFWIATLGQGLWRSTRSNTSFDRIMEDAGLSSNVIRALFEDREGNIWVGTPSGLDQISRRKITPVRDLGFAISVESSSDGSVWVGSDRGLIRIKGNTQRVYTTRDGLPNAIIRTLFSDRAGALWVATDQGVVRFEHERFIPLLVPQGRRFYRISAITADSSGGVWLCDQFQGVFRLTDKGLASFDMSPEVNRRTAYTAITDSRDRVWIGLSGASVGLFEQDGQFSLLDGTGLSGSITSLVEGHDHVIWAGGGNGVSRYANGQFTAATTRRNGFPASGVTAIVEDGHSLWIGTYTGIIRIDEREFDRIATDANHRIQYKLYDDTDGMAAMPDRFADRAATRASDGRLWFVTDGGAAIVDPKDVEVSRLPPRVRIEDVQSDGRRFTVVSGLTLPPRSSRLEIAYTALAFASPASIRFQYRLDGFDKDWVDAGTRRQAVYTNLAPGAYRFRVRASDKEGASDASDTAVAFTVLPAFFETRWFYILCVALAGILGVGAWRVRLATIHRRFSLVLAERTRIARDIHDTLLQSLVFFALEAGSIAEDAPEPIGTHLMQLRRELEFQIREARESISNLRSPALERVDLITALRETGERISRQESVRFSLAVSGQLRECPPDLEEQLLRIGQEALTNAGRHARAREIRLEIAFETDIVRLRIMDDGVGFDAAFLTDATSHFGLLSMQERADQIGAQFTVTTSPGGGGTEVVVVVPHGAAIYA
jgi:signal transduction histidine kinase/ligand-binding sensor domain-containing protein